MKQYIISNGGRYFVEGAGFTGTRQTATRITEANLRSTQDCLARTTGSRGNVEVAPNSSFGVCYVRKQNIARNYSGRPVVNADKNNPSAKRFASEGEAHNHGARNTKTQGHSGYFVIETTDPVTHYVSTKEDKDGLTCPIANK